MAKLATSALTIVLLAVNETKAASCKAFNFYFASELLALGYEQCRFTDAFRWADQPNTRDRLDNSLFMCTGSGGFAVIFDRYCPDVQGGNERTCGAIRMIEQIWMWLVVQQLEKISK
ncbi:hypothetical protein QBC44DRAFT_359247 [Cladorrhinum sp. PSN332]|nr:hypothetical protein QBC44DRAFT_359247 [Cladorrhinum sp. PSN332]